MKDKNLSVKSLSMCIVCSIVALGMVQVQAASDDDESMEEIVVTGSFIRRDNFDVSSPLDVVTADSIAELGASTLGQTIFNQSYNYGVDIIQNSLAINGTDSSNTYANIRGLGTAATLDLMNNKRGHGNAQYGYPMIAIQRIETLLDGASAIYGSNAVAGVVNYIPYTDYEGLKMKLDYRSRVDGDFDEKVFAFLFGVEYDEGNLVAAFERRDRSALFGYDLPHILGTAQMYSFQGHPGRWQVPGHGFTDANENGVYDAGEVITNLARTGRADPNCGRSTAESNTDPSDAGRSVLHNNRLGILLFDTYCTLDFGEWWDQSNWRQQDAIYVHFTYAFTDRVRLITELVFDKSKDDYRQSAINSGASYGEVETGVGGALVGDHPGNPYRAFLNVDSDRGYLAGTDLLLFASDVCTATACAGVGDGIPDRDVNGDGIPDPGVQKDARYAVVLAEDPFNLYDAVTNPTGGVPFNYDVGFDLWRPVGKDVQGIPSAQRRDGSSENVYKWYWARYIAELEIDVGDTWIVNMDYIYTTLQGTGADPRASTSQMIAGLRGMGGEDQDAYFNPWATSQYLCIDYVCQDTLTPADHPAFNRQDVLDRIIYKTQDDTYEVSHTFDFIMSTSDLWEVPWVGSNVGIAFGGQHIKFEHEFDPEEGGQTCNRWNAGCLSEEYWDRTTTAFFFEFRLPVLQHDTFGYVELSLSGRHTDINDIGTSFDPKVGILYQPMDNLSVRASWGTSFIAPTLNQVYSRINSALHNVGDLTCDHDPNCSPGKVYVMTLTGGNPELQPETAVTWNVGFTLLLLEGDLKLEADYTRIEFEDRITSSNGAEVVELDYRGFLAYLAGVCSPNEKDTACAIAARQTWITSMQSPNIIRTAGGALDTLLAKYFNAAFMNVSSVDIRAGYRLDTDWGNFIFGLQASHVAEWKYQLSPITPVYDAAGLRNDFNATVYPMPEWRIESRTVWSMNNHQVSLLGHFYSHVDDRIPDSTGPEGNLDNWGPANRIPSSARWDLQYSYTSEGLIGNGSTEMIVGVNNVLDKDVYVFRDGGGFESYLSDPVGALWYVRVNHVF